MWLPSAIPGFRASTSRQRSPLPRFWCASFQSESPGFTVTTFSWLATAAGAAGWEGVTRTAGGRDGETREGADTKVLGRSKGERFTGGRTGANRGATGFESRGCSGISGGLGEASAGAAAGRWNSADCCSFCDCFCLRNRRATSPRGALAEISLASTASWFFSAVTGASGFFFAATCARSSGVRI